MSESFDEIIARANLTALDRESTSSRDLGRSISEALGSELWPGDDSSGGHQAVVQVSKVASVAPARETGKARTATPEITYRPRRWLIIFPLGLLALSSLILHQRLLAGHHHIPPAAIVIWILTLGAIVAQILLAWLGRPYTSRPPKGRATVIVPCYNEDPAYLQRVLDSLRDQTRPADAVVVCDDGSKVDYTELIDAYPEVTWLRQANAGKKHAQAACFIADPQADFYVTIDSDSALERKALMEGLRPFADKRVMAVAGLEWASNYSKNILTRAIGARSVAFQLYAMSSQSTARGNVLIAPGAFSIYRGSVIREALPAYLGETFAGVKVTLGDDTMLTLFALMHGRVVQQPTAVSFPAYPEKLSHHLRQWTRWMRASIIRQVWRIRYLKLSSYAWWFSVWQIGAFTAGCAATALVFLAWPDSQPLLVGSFVGLLIWPCIMACRLACISRTDQGFWSKVGGVALMPLAGLWYLLVLRQIRFYGMATCTRQGWVTRQKVEVTLDD